MKLLDKLNTFIKNPVWFILFFVNFIYTLFVNKDNTVIIANWISLLASIFTLITAGTSIYAYVTVNGYKANLLRKCANKENIKILKKTIASIEDDYANKRTPNNPESVKKYVEELARENNLIDAFGVNYRIIMETKKLDRAATASFINAATAIIKICNESEKL